MQGRPRYYLGFVCTYSIKMRMINLNSAYKPWRRKERKSTGEKNKNHS